MPSPYKILYDSVKKDYYFDTEKNIRYRLVIYHRPELLQGYEAVKLNVYELSFFPEQNIKAKKDSRIEETIISYLQDFFKNEENALVVVYDSLDGRQHVRNILFKRWISKYDTEGILEQFDFKIELMKDKILEGQFLFRADHPQHRFIIEMINSIVKELQSLK